jgi:hypothetical protein
MTRLYRRCNRRVRHCSTCPCGGHRRQNQACKKPPAGMLHASLPDRYGKIGPGGREILVASTPYEVHRGRAPGARPSSRSRRTVTNSSSVVGQSCTRSGRLLRRSAQHPGSEGSGWANAVLMSALPCMSETSCRAPHKCRSALASLGIFQRCFLPVRIWFPHMASGGPHFPPLSSRPSEGVMTCMSASARRGAKVARQTESRTRG